MDQRRAKDCGSAKGSRYSRNNFKLYLRIFYSNLVHKACHSVNPCVSAADHGNHFALHSLLKGKNTAVHFFFHGSGKKLFIRKSILYKIHINGISDNGIASL